MIREELMNGDWVYDKHYNGDIEPIKIYNIYGTEVNCKTERNRFDVDEIVSGTYMSDLQPIPLTPEILEKNGFRKQNNSSGVIRLDTYWLGEEIGFHLHSFGTDYYQFGLAKIRYVHELQHALKLCGIDKPIIV